MIVTVAVVAGGYIFPRSSEKRVSEETPTVSQGIAPDSIEQITSVPIERNAAVYRSSTCGCCLGYIAALEKQGFAVEVQSLEERGMDLIKKQYAIPPDRQSCHTTVIGDYFIEGHVPLEAIEKLLTEKPKIDGIGLPGMPIGTPGMPGVKQVPYEIYQKSEDSFSQFMTL